MPRIRYVELKAKQANIEEEEAQEREELRQRQAAHEGRGYMLLGPNAT